MLNGSFVGFLHVYKEAVLLQHCFIMERCGSIKVSSMGGKMVLLQSSVAGEIERVQREHHQWWCSIFKEVRCWTPNLVAKNRKVWLRFYGIPLHVWEESTFKKLGSIFGEFLDFDEATIERRRLDLARILVSTNRMGFIQDVVKINVMGAVFGVSVVEEGDVTVVDRVEDPKVWEMESSGGVRS